MIRIFISHAWEDKSFVRQLESALTGDRIEVWVDHTGIRSGDNLPKQISDALEWCNTVILIWSAESSKSRWVELEWTSAITLNKKVIPCLIDTTSLPPLLSSIAYIDFQKFSEGLTRLLNAIKSDRNLNLNQSEKLVLEIAFLQDIISKCLERYKLRALERGIPIIVHNDVKSLPKFY